MSSSTPLSAADKSVLAYLAPYLWPKGEPLLRARVVASLLCLVTANVVMVTLPLLYKEVVDLLTQEGAASQLSEPIFVPVWIIIAYGAARVMALTFNQIRDALFAKVGQRAVRRVALTVFRHLHSLSLQFHLERQTGGLTRLIERGVKAIESLLSFVLFSVGPTIIELSLSCAVLGWFYGVEVAVIAFVTVAIYIFYTYQITEWRLRLRREMNESDQNANTRAVDSLINFETVKYFGNEEHEAERYDVGLRRYEKAATATKTSLSILNIGQAAIMGLGLTCLMLLAAFRVADGSYTTGDFVAINAYMLQMAQPLNFIGFVYREIKQSLIDMEAMFRLLDVAPTVLDKAVAPPLKVEGASVLFKNVVFSYRPDRTILKGVSFVIPAGRTVAVVGSSGAGKSTLSRLLYRFYDPDSGSIEIDGQDIGSVSQDSLRAAIGIVPQDTVLFNDSIAYNIAYGRPGASREEIERGADLAHISEFIGQLPDGFETIVGERGLKLSGGEKQRVAIARSILKDPKILIFDEATSALDTKTERDILASLKEVSRGRTTLVVAHRLSTIVDSDEIIVLDKGRVAERGNHRDLLDQDGLYAEMWRRQQEEQSGEA